MKAKKSLGQHFFTSSEILRKVLLRADIPRKNIIIEIGPGRGIFTKEILDLGYTVIAIEKDRDLIPYLQELFPEEQKTKQLTIVEGDILDQKNLKKIEGNKYSVIGNIPYYITGKILRMFLQDTTTKPEEILFLVQKEVADRIIARDKKESLLSLSVKLYGEPEIIQKAPRGMFVPQPKVDSAFVLVSKIKEGFRDKKREDLYFEFLKKIFSGKRKQIGSKIKGLSWEKALQQNNIDPRTRAEDLTLEETKRMFEVAIEN